MSEISWLDFFILVLTSFSIIHLTLNRLSAYFAKKTYLAKWILCMLTSGLIVLFRFYIPYSIFYLMAFAVAGCVELLTDLTGIRKVRTNDLNKEDYIGIRSVVGDMINNYNYQKKDKEKNMAVQKPANEKKKPKVPNIIDSKRFYNQQEFLRESESGNIILSNFLKTNLNKSNRDKK